MRILVFLLGFDLICWGLSSLWRLRLVKVKTLGQGIHPEDFLYFIIFVFLGLHQHSLMISYLFNRSFLSLIMSYLLKRCFLSMGCGIQRTDTQD